MEESKSEAPPAKVLIEELMTGTYTGQYIFCYVNGRLFRLGLESAESKETQVNLQLSQIEFTYEEQLLKMKWFYLAKSSQTVCVFLDGKGTISIGILAENKVEIVYQKQNLLDEDLIKTSIVNVALQYLGNELFKIMICSDSMVTISVDIIISFKSGKVSNITELTEVQNLANVFSLSTQFIYKLIHIPSLNASVFLARKEIYVLSHENDTLLCYELRKFSLRNCFIPF